MQQFQCKKCEGELMWDINAHALKCPYCDSVYQPEEFDFTTQQKITQVDGEHTTDGSSGDTLVKYKCDECGAEVVTAAGTIATTCAFCGHALSMSEKLVGNFKPDFVIPFSVDKKQAMKIYKKYAKSGFFTPTTFQDDKHLKNIKGVYIPFWLHSFCNESCTSIKYDDTHVMRVGDDKVVVCDKYRSDVYSRAIFDKIPTDGLKSLDNQLMDELKPFNYEHLEVFHPGYMAGFYAEEYDEQSQNTVDRARQCAKDEIERLILPGFNGYNNVQVTDYEDRQSGNICQYAMFPIWFLSIEYKKRNYLFAINGSTGEIVGKLPLNWGRLFRLAGIVFAISYLALTLLSWLL